MEHDNFGFVTNSIDKFLAREAYVEIEYNRYGVSDTNMYSRGYSNCNGVVLLSGGFAGLSHYDLERGMPEVYLPSMIDEIKKISKKDIKAVLVAGDERHFKKNKWILDAYKIHVVSELIDYWGDDELVQFTHPDCYNSKDEKEIFVVLYLEEVVLYSKIEGCINLHSKQFNSTKSI